MKHNSALRTLILLVSFMLLKNNLLSAQTYKSVTEAKGLAVGTKAPIFTAQNQNDSSYSIAEALKKGPVVVLFFRGQWCPVCNRHLSQLQDSLQQIYDKAATVVAISPESSEYLKMTEEKTHAGFNLLYDKDYSIGDAFDVTFLPEQKVVDMYNNRLNAQLDKSHSDNSNRLPIPATFIIDKNGVIVWRQFNPDYKIRASVKEILNNVPAE